MELQDINVNIHVDTSELDEAIKKAEQLLALLRDIESFKGKETAMPQIEAKAHMTAGECIKAARKKAGLTQVGLADRMGTTYQTVAQWETGKRNPKLESLFKIADALGVSWVELAGSYFGLDAEQRRV